MIEFIIELIIEFIMENWISLIGVGLSITAFRTAKNVKDAVKKTIGNSNIQKDIRELIKILAALEAAKDAAIVWEPFSSEKSQTGRDPKSDYAAVKAAINDLTIWTPSNMDADIQENLKNVQKDLELYCSQVADESNSENNWPGVVSSIQSLIRLLRAHKGDLENSQLAVV
jgi:hypothetical protein